MGEDGKVVYKVVIDDSGVVSEAERAGNDAADALEDSAKRGSKTYEEIMTGAARRVGEALVNMALRAGKALVNFAMDSIELASDLQEVQNVVDVTFGKGAESVNAWAQAAAEAYGLSELSALKYTSTIGAMFKSMGLGQKDIQAMSTGIAGLAGDMASFYNLEPDVAFEKLRAGISGETEPLKQLGINMSVVNLEAYAMSRGITKAYTEMTQAEQATLRYNYIMYATADAQGDFSRTSDSLANQQRILRLEVEQLSADFGEVLMPVALAVVGALRDMVQWVRENSTTLTVLGIIIAALTIAIIAYNASLALAASGMTLATLAATAFGTVLAFITSPITLVTLAIGALIAIGYLLVKHWEEVSAFFKYVWGEIKNAFTNAINAITNAIKNWWATVKQFFSDGIRAIFSYFNIDWSGIGRNIVYGILEGIRQAWNTLVQAFYSALNNLWSGAKGILGIASPSKKFKYIGEMSVEGVEAGFDTEFPTLNRKVYTAFENLGGIAETGLSIPTMTQAAQDLNINIAGKSSGSPIQITVVSELDGREVARSTAWSMGEQLAWEEM